MHCKPQQEVKNANSTYTFFTAPYEIQQILCTILLCLYLAGHSQRASMKFLHKFSTFFTLSTCFSDFIPGILYFFVFLLFVTFISTLWWLLLFTFILWVGIVILLRREQRSMRPLAAKHHHNYSHDTVGSYENMLSSLQHSYSLCNFIGWILSASHSWPTVLANSELQFFVITVKKIKKLWLVRSWLIFHSNL